MALSTFTQLYNCTVSKITEKPTTNKHKLKIPMKMNLQDYYESLARETPPKTAFIQEIAATCGVTVTTVRTWIKDGKRPADPEHIAVLASVTGIAAEELWSNG